MCLPGLMPKAPNIPKPPAPQDPLAAANRLRQQRAGAQGYNSTILTSGLGDTSQATTAPKSILGG